MIRYSIIVLVFFASINAINAASGDNSQNEQIPQNSFSLTNSTITFSVNQPGMRFSCDIVDLKGRSIASFSRAYSATGFQRVNLTALVPLKKMSGTFLIKMHFNEEMFIQKVRFSDGHIYGFQNHLALPQAALNKTAMAVDSANKLPPYCESSLNVEFPNLFPGQIITVRKYYNPKTGEAWMASDDGKIKSRLDLEKLQRDNEAANINIYGAISKHLLEALTFKSSNDTIKVVIGLKGPEETCLDKSTHTMEEMRQSSLNALRIEQDDAKVKKENIRQKYSISFENDMLVCDLTKAQIMQMSIDPDIISIVEYSNVPVLYGCNAFPNQIPIDHSADLKTLANSAYNPASSMDPNYLGQGVNAATFETGIHPTLVSCIQTRGQTLGVVDLNPDVYANGHSNCTFECLAQTAWRANLYHHYSLTWYNPSDIITPAIKHG